MHIGPLTPKDQPASSTSRRNPEPDQAAFDRWLHQKLGRLYDSVLREPVPESLRRLLERNGP